jgi:hypothetical protein
MLNWTTRKTGGSVSLQWPSATRSKAALRTMGSVALCRFVDLHSVPQSARAACQILPSRPATCEALVPYVPPNMFKRPIFNLDFAKRCQKQVLWQNADSETLPQYATMQPDATGQSTKGGGGRTFTGAAWAMGILGILGLRFLEPSLQGFTYFTWIVKRLQLHRVKERLRFLFLQSGGLKFLQCFCLKITLVFDARDQAMEHLTLQR